MGRQDLLWGRAERETEGDERVSERERERKRERERERERETVSED